MNDQELEDLRAYAAQMGLLGNQPTVVDPNVDRFASSPDVDALQAYAKQMGLLNQQPTVVDPSVDRFAPAAHTTLDFAIPGVPGDVKFAPTNNPPAPLPTPAGNLDVSAFPVAPPPTPVALQAPDQGAFTDAESAVDKQARINAINAQAKPGAPVVTEADAAPGSVPMRPPVMFGPSGTFVPPHQVDLLNPTGKDDTNRTEYDAGWNDQFKALNEKNVDLERQTSDRMEALDAQRARMQAAYDEQKAMLTAQLVAQQDHAAAMANAKQWADSAADAAQKEAADAKVDQGHFFASRGAGQQIALVIGAALGALGSSLTNTPNYALQMIQGAMADDMQAQQANLANKRASADSALKRALNATGDLDAAKNLVRLQQLQVAQNQIDSYAKMDLADEQKAKLMEIHDGLKAQILDTRGRMMQDRAIKDMQLRPMVGGGMVGGGAGGAAGGADRALVFSAPDGQSYSANSAEDKKILAAKSQGAQDISNLVGNIEAVTKQDGWRTSPQARAQLSSYFEQLWLAAKDGTNGMNSENDAKVLQRAIGDPFALLEDGTKVAKRFAALRNAQFQTAVKTYAAEPVQRGYTVTPTGDIKPGAKYTGQSPDAGTVPKSFKPGL